MNNQRNKDTFFSTDGQTAKVDPFSYDLNEDLPNDGQSQSISGSSGYAAMIAELEIKPTDHIPEPPVCLSVEQDGKSSVIGTTGNFSLLIGKAKSRKTFAVGLAVAAALSRDPIFGLLKGNFSKTNNVVIYFDTEQSKYHVQRSINRVCRLINEPDPSNLRAFGLRALNPAQRIGFIEYIIENVPGVGLVIIDGIRDLVTDINDPEQATEIATMLLRWTEQNDFHLLTVLHQNKGDNNARGHLGTELVNKAETVISVTKEPRQDYSIVAPEYCRDRDFESFAFTIENGLPCLLPSIPKRLDGSPKNDTTDPDTMSLKGAKRVIDRAFSEGEALGYAATRTAIVEAASFCGYKMGNSKAEVFIRRFVEEGLIKKVKPKKGNHTYQSAANDVVS